ncbi:MAG: TniQ family protein [Pyrinomonadaceae bacterium]|nr:TniQ family protein [Pyrinomonadaceae bacterium]
MGIGTGSVECLTSYTSRLAAAHCLSPAVLLGRTLAPLMGKKYWLQGGARPGTRGSALGNSFGVHAKAVNGTGIIAKDWITVLECLTLRNDLGFLTMRPWSKVFTQRNLLRSMRAWCPSCYEEWRENDQIIYEPLSWTFREVEVCLHHRRRLRFQCHHCVRKLPWLARCTRPGYCSKCSQWLGTGFSEHSPDMVIPDDELEWQMWVGKSLEEMIVGATHLPSPPKERMAKAVSLCIAQASEGIMNRFACLIGKRKNTVWGWQHGKTQIPINDLLRICYRVRVSLVDFLYSEFFIPREVEFFPIVSVSGVTTTRRTPRPFDRETTELALRTMLKDQPPFPMKEVATRLNVDKRFLYKHFPVLCKAISARNAKHQDVYYEKLRRQYEKDIKHATSRLRSSGIYPSRRRVAALISKPEGLRGSVRGKPLLPLSDLHIAA